MSPAPATDYVLRGHRAKQAGEAFEAWLAAQHRLAEHRGVLAWARAVSPRVRWVGHGAAARAKVVGDACADFLGQLADGRALVVEAKSRRAADGPLYFTEIEPQQREQLDACARHAGVALLALEFREVDGFVLTPRRFVVPWPSVPWRVRKTAQSLALEDLIACGTDWQVRADLYLLPFVERRADAAGRP